MKQNILIIGPIGDIGGREIETGFIADTLSHDYNITICSTANFTSKSQIFDFVSKNEVINLNKLIFTKNWWFKLLSIIAYIKSFNKQPILNFLNNGISRKTGFRGYTLKQINKIIDKNDLIIVCAQISSNYIEEVVKYAHHIQKPIVFRTSNTIKDSDKNHKTWLNKVTLYVHHSLSNAERLSFIDPYNFHLIDQCTFKEDVMLKLAPSNQFKSLLYIGRLSSEKGISELVSFFKSYKTNLILNVIGDGELYESLKQQSSQLENVNMLGFLNQDEIMAYIKQTDALVIPSHEESGPLVGLEAMASARIIISTKVGAMPDRLKHCKNQFWFNINDLKSLERAINTVKDLQSSEIEKIAIENRSRYLEKYKIELIQSQYKNVIFKLLNQTS